jgi:hypothetical protein
MSLMLAMLVSVTACDNDAQKVKKDEHVWKDQVKALDKAKGVEKMLNDSAMQQMKRVDEQSQ